MHNNRVLIPFLHVAHDAKCLSPCVYNPFLVYCRELAPSTVSLTGDWAQGDDSKDDSHYTRILIGNYPTTLLYHKNANVWVL